MKIKINNRLVGDKEPCFIIAEAGVNHNGDLNRAKQMIESASAIEADAIKFQTFKADEVVIKKAPSAEYQKKSNINFESQYQMLKKLEFLEEQWFELADFSKDVGITFLSKAPYEAAVDLLLKIDIPAFKIGSGEITYLTLIRHVAKTGLPIILSTGMSTLEEIETAVDIINSEKNKQIILLHCTSNYPTKIMDVNLRAMITMKQKFQLPIGYSDHTLGIIVPISAVTLGACVIEKHFTLDKKLPGPDQKLSLEPHEFREMINSIRIVEDSLGDPVKKPIEAEKEMRVLARKSIVANVDIIKGEIITMEMLAFKRPGTGLSQKYLDAIVGKEAKINIRKDDIIQMNMV